MHRDVIKDKRDLWIGCFIRLVNHETTTKRQSFICIVKPGVTCLLAGVRLFICMGLLTPPFSKC